MNGFFRQQHARKCLFLPLSCAFGLGIVYAVSQANVALAQTKGWVRDGISWKYQISENSYAKQWFKTPDGRWWYFDKDYKLVTGKVTDKGYDYWMDVSSGLVYNAWIRNDDGSWMLTDQSGCLTKGWYKTANDKWWYFGNDHKLLCGKVTDKGYDYWIDPSRGLVHDSWVQDTKGIWMHTDKWGCLVKGWYHSANDKWWYFDKDYKLVAGKVTDKGYSYWIDYSNGLTYNAWVQDEDKKWMHTDESGCLVKGWYKTPNGKWWYFDKDYKLVTGKVTDKGYDYWIDPSRGLVYDTWVKNDQDQWMFTDRSGCLLKGWLEVPDGRKWFFKDDHTMVLGEVLIGDEICRFTADDGLISRKSKPESPSSDSKSKPDSTKKSDSATDGKESKKDSANEKQTTSESKQTDVKDKEEKQFNVELFLTLSHSQ